MAVGSIARRHCRRPAEIGRHRHRSANTMDSGTRILRQEDGRRRHNERRVGALRSDGSGVVWLAATAFLQLIVPMEERRRVGIRGRASRTAVCAGLGALGIWEGNFAKKCDQEWGWRAVFVKLPYLSSQPLDLDLAPLIGVSIVSTGELVSTRYTPSQQTC
jgi:hypothetical protein